MRAATRCISVDRLDVPFPPRLSLGIYTCASTDIHLFSLQIVGSEMASLSKCAANRNSRRGHNTCFSKLSSRLHPKHAPLKQHIPQLCKRCIRYVPQSLDLAYQRKAQFCGNFNFELSTWRTPGRRHGVDYASQLRTAAVELVLLCQVSLRWYYFSCAFA